FVSLLPSIRFRAPCTKLSERGLPSLAAEMLARRWGSRALVHALARAALKASVLAYSRFRRRSPSFIAGTPRARRHLFTVDAPTPHRCATSHAASRRTARTKSL